MTTAEGPTYTFDTSNHAMWAEEVASENAVPVRVVSAPASSKAKCGIALRVDPSDAERLEHLLAGEGIKFHRHQERGA